MVKKHRKGYLKESILNRAIVFQDRLHLKRGKKFTCEKSEEPSTADGKRVPDATFVGSLIASEKDFYCNLNIFL